MSPSPRAETAQTPEAQGGTAERTAGQGDTVTAETAASCRHRAEVQSSGTTDGFTTQGSREGHVGSDEVTIRFSPLTRDRMEIETLKWCQMAWLVEQLR